MPGLLMRQSDVVALVPGAYLVATRYPGMLQMAGFFWLEILPMSCLLLFVAGTKALLFVFFHWAFLGLYEIGYWVNDRASTSRERSCRPQFSLDRNRLVVALIGRLAVLAVCVCLGALWFDTDAALAFTGAAAAVFLLLLLHSFVGTLTPALAKLRVVTFAGLAFGKYAPAALAVAPVPVVTQALGWIFLLYGGGRVVEYGLLKVENAAFDMQDVKALWYLAALMPAIALIEYSEYGRGLLTSLWVFGAYFLLRAVKRIAQRFT